MNTAPYDMPRPNAVFRSAVSVSVCATPTGGMYVAVADDGSMWAIVDHYGRFSDWRELPALPNRK